MASREVTRAAAAAKEKTGQTVAQLVVGRLCEVAGAMESAPLAFFGVPGDFRCVFEERREREREAFCEAMQTE